MLARKDDAATAQMLAATDTKLGIIAGLTFAAAASHKQQQASDAVSDDDGDGDGRSASASLSDGSAAALQPPEAAETSPWRSRAVAGGRKAAAASASACPLQEQRDTIRRLQEHNQLLKAELAIEQRDARALLATDARARVSELQRLAARFGRKVALAQRKLEALELQVQRAQRELEAQRRLALAAEGEAAETSTAGAARRLRSLENRLELSLVKRNELESVNKHLSARIDKVRRDRVIFDGIYKKLEREASAHRQRHTQSTAELERARAARLQLTAELERVQAGADAEQRDFERQFLDLRREIEAWRQAHGGDVDAIALELGPPPTEAIAAAPVSTTAGTSGGGGGKKSALARVAARTTWKIGLERALGTDADALVARYDAAFEEIRHVTGMDDTRALCEELLARDDANFQRFRRVEELSREQVALQAQVAQLAASMDEYKAREGIASSATQKQQLRAAQRQLAALRDSNRELELEADALQTVFARVKSSVHSVHNLLVHSTAAKGSVATSNSGSALGTSSGANGSTASANGGASGGASAPGAAVVGDGGDWLQLGGRGASALPQSAREVTDANILEYLRAIETYASRLVAQSGLAGEQGETSAGAGDRTPSPSAVAAPPRPPVVLPLGLGPSTLPSDPKHKLQVLVPSLGGVDGVIVLPPHSEPLATVPKAGADPLLRSPTSRSLLAAQAQTLPSPVQSPLPPPHLQQQRKKGSKFELYKRKSISQQQFAAALAAAAAPAGDGGGNGDTGADTDADGGKPQQQRRLPRMEPTEEDNESQHTSGSDKEPDEDEEEERALTYDELRRFAAKNLTTRRRGD